MNVTLNEPEKVQQELRRRKPSAGIDSQKTIPERLPWLWIVKITPPSTLIRVTLCGQWERPRVCYECHREDAAWKPSSRLRGTFRPLQVRLRIVFIICLYEYMLYTSTLLAVKPLARKASVGFLHENDHAL